jgi:rhodanese-related sulfurtransferase
MDWITVAIVIMAIGLILLPRLRWRGVGDARRQFQNGAILLDVRSPMEVASAGVKGAVSIPLGQIAQEISQKGWSKEQELLVFCASGARSAVAVRELQQLGFVNAVNLGSAGRARSVAAA